MTLVCESVPDADPDCKEIDLKATDPTKDSDTYIHAEVMC